MNNLLLKLMLLFACLSINACGRSTQEIHGSELSIYGGAPVVSGEWRNVVWIGGCTGTIVHPRLVITAAHCKPQPGQSVVIGNNENGGERFNAVDARSNPTWNGGSQTDIAFLVLDQDITGVDIIPVLSDPSEIQQILAPGYSSTLVGFGETDNGSVGTKYIVETNVVNNTPGGELSIGGNGKDACYGDSGGPAFGKLPTGEWRVYGVTSQGAYCGGGGTWSKMHEWFDWIEQTSGIKFRGSNSANASPAVAQNSARNTSNQEISRNQQGGIDVRPAPNVANVLICLNSESLCLDRRVPKTALLRNSNQLFVTPTTMRIPPNGELTFYFLGANGALLQRKAFR